MPSVLDILLVPVFWGYVLLAQYTKVEESFNIQAVHDIIYHGLNVSKYDHVEFPGAVPRTFIGSILLAAITKPVTYFMPPAFTKQDGQIVARAMLSLVNAIMLVYLKDAAFSAVKAGSKELSTVAPQSSEKKPLKKKGGKVVKKATPATPSQEYSPWSFGLWFTLFIITQFHIPFYSSRTLPNFFALPFTNYAFAQMFKGNYTRSIGMLAFTAIVFRVEVVLLMLTLGLAYVLYNKLTVPQLIKPAVIGGGIGFFLSLGVDSFFWQRYTVPEVESFIFNVIEGKSSEWGTEPFTQYFTKYFLSMYMPPHVPLLAVLGYFVDPTKNILRLSAFATLSFVTLISFQPHKEWRFIIYISPIITLLGANGAAWITSKGKKSFWYSLLALIVFGSAAAGMAGSLAFAIISSYNYPGGVALTKFTETIMMKLIYKQLDPETPITVHIDTLGCMTGVTHFGEVAPLSNLTINYDKTEDHDTLWPMWETFDFIITETDLSKDHKGEKIPFLKNWRWKKIDTITGYDGIDVRGFRYLNPIDLGLNIYFQKSIRPFMTAVGKLVHLEPKLHLYERVPAPVDAAHAQEDREIPIEKNPKLNFPKQPGAEPVIQKAPKENTA